MTAVEPQAAAGTREQLIRQLVGLGGVHVQADGAARGAITLRVPAGALEEATNRLAGRAGVRLADMFAADGDTTVLRLVWAYEAEEPGYIITESEIEGEQYPSLSDIAPAAFVEECEIYEQFGIRPAGDKPLNRLMLPPHAGAAPSSLALPTLGHEPPRPPEDVHALHTVGGQAFEFPFGPVRQVGVESLYYGLVTSGEEVVDLYLFAWHKHRGVEWRLRGRTPREAIFLAERAEGLSAAMSLHLSHFQAMLLFALAISVAFGFLSRRPPLERVKYIIWSLFLFLLIGVGIGWAMYPFSR